MSATVRRRWLMPGLLAVALIVVAGVLSGVIPGSLRRDSARPPCEQLPPEAAVQDAIAARPDLVARLEGVGPGVSVGAEAPCDDWPDRAIVTVTYRTAAEWQGVDAILRQDGFGVALQLVHRRQR